MVELNLYTDYTDMARFFDGSSRLITGAKKENSTDGEIYRKCSLVVQGPEEAREKSPEFLEALYSIYKKSSRMDMIDNIIVHGSYGDFTTNNFSDVDITLLIKQKFVESEKGRRAVQKYVKEVVFPFIFSWDLLQHHGPFYLWPSLITNYDNSILPVQVYEKTWALKETKLDFVYKETTGRSKAIITCNNLPYLSEITIKSPSLYAAKRLLSNLMILPAFYMMDIGFPCHKADSFENFYDRFDENAQAIIKATEIRNNWPLVCFPFNIYPKLVGIAPLNPMRTISFAGRFYTSKEIQGKMKKEVIPYIPKLCKAVKEDFESRGFSFS